MHTTQGLNGIAASYGLTPDGLGAFYDADGNYYEHDGLGGFFSDIGNFVKRNVQSAGKSIVRLNAQILNAPIIKQLLPIAGTLIGVPPSVTQKIQQTMLNMQDNGDGISLNNAMGSIMQTIAPASEMTQEQVQTVADVQQVPVQTLLDQNKAAQIVAPQLTRMLQAAPLLAPIPTNAQTELIAKMEGLKLENLKMEVRQMKEKNEKLLIDAAAGKMPEKKEPAKQGMSTTTMALIGVGAAIVIGGGVYVATKK